MADLRILVPQFAQPVLGFLMTDFRNLADPGAVVDITGYTIKLAVKRDVNDPDSYELFDLTASLDADPTTGKYYFTFTREHTCFRPDTYPGEVRWWAAGLVPATDLPTDRQTVDYIVQQAVDVSL